MLISGLIGDRLMAGLLVRFGAVMAFFKTILVACPVACV